ncbi:hypothetical protein [Amycolatopsis solani]|uniref:hypothetical protein n=1 Tax=Amycolatopsis solani TaxID=3028615 RepID=UPI0025B21B12|nr:hypothetical protein [Amycolatopsis sp. MEP2-6]
MRKTLRLGVAGAALAAPLILGVAGVASAETGGATVPCAGYHESNVQAGPDGAGGTEVNSSVGCDGTENVDGGTDGGTSDSDGGGLLDSVFGLL